MSPFKDILKKFAFLISGKIFQPITSLLLIIYIARSVGASLLGAYDIVVSFIAVFQIIATFGFKYIIAREIPRSPNDSRKFLFHALVAIIPITIVCSLVMVSFAFLLNYPTEITRSIIIACIILFATSLIDLCEGMYIGVGKLKHYSAVTIVENLLKIALSILVLYMGGRLIGIITVFAGTRILAATMNLIFLRRLLPPWKAHFDWPFLKNLLSSSSIMALILIVATMYGKVDILMLSYISGVEEVGYYGAAYRFIVVSQLLLASFGTILLPNLSLFKSNMGKEFQEFCTKVIHYLLWVVFPVVLVIALQADTLVTFLFGPKFVLSADILSILIWLIVPYSFITVADNILLSTNNQKIDLKINIVSLLMNIIFNTLLIPKYGAKGASFATLLSTMSYFVIQYQYLKNNIINLNLFKIFFMPLGASLIMGFFMIYLKNRGFMVSSLIGISAYLLILFLCLFFLREKGSENVYR